MPSDPAEPDDKPSDIFWNDLPGAPHNKPIDEESSLTSYEERIKILENFWRVYNELGPGIRRSESQESEKVHIEQVRKHFNAPDYYGSVFHLEWLVNRELRRLRKSTAAILEDLRRMDQRDRKRRYRARKKQEKEEQCGDT